MGKKVFSVGDFDGDGFGDFGVGGDGAWQGNLEVRPLFFQFSLWVSKRSVSLLRTILEGEEDAAQFGHNADLWTQMGTGILKGLSGAPEQIQGKRIVDKYMSAHAIINIGDA